MSNAFYTFVNFFVSGTTVKAKPLNEQFQAVQAGFDNVENNAKAALKIAGYSSFAQITATPSSFLMLDSSGVPYASATVPFSPNFGGNRAQNIGTATVSTDAPNLGQVQTLINTAAYGSPTVMSVPALAGNALKALRVNAGATATEWVNALPTTSGTGEVLSTAAGVTSWQIMGGNMLSYSSLELGLGGSTGWTVGVGAVISDQNASGLAGVRNSNFLDPGVEVIKTANEHAPLAVPGAQYVASVKFQCGANASNAVSLFMRFLDSSYVAIGADTTTNVSASTDNVARRYAVTATAPVGTSYVICGLLTTGSVLTSNSFVGSQFQIEKASVPSPWMDVRTAGYFYKYMKFVEHNLDLVGGFSYVKLGTNQVPAAFHFKASTSSGSDYSARIYAPVSGSAVGDGELNVEAKLFRMGKAAGYAALVANGATGAAKTIDFTNGAKQTATLDNNATITLTAPPGTIVLDGLKLILKQDATGGRTVTFTSSATIKWAGGTAPVAQVAANSETMVNLFWDGTRFIGSWYEL